MDNDCNGSQNSAIRVKSNNSKIPKKISVDKQRVTKLETKEGRCAAENQSHEENDHECEVTSLSKVTNANENQDHIVKNEFISNSGFSTKSDERLLGSESVMPIRLYATTYRVIEIGTLDELFNKKNKAKRLPRNSIDKPLTMDHMIQTGSIYGPLINKKIKFS